MAHNKRSRRLQPKNARGWKIIYVEGDARRRGFMHGAALHAELSELMKMFPVTLRKNNEITLDEYLKICNHLARKQFDEKCTEWREELEGMTEGALSKGVVVSVDFLFGVNMYLGIDSYFNSKLNAYASEMKKARREKAAERCSAFIATGDATTDGKIVMAHNTHCEFIWAPFSNIIQHVRPDKGFNFVMQTGPGLLSSNMDWFLCESGIVGCETTIADTTYLPKYGIPYFCRIRECMQYGKTLEDYERIMCKGNAGDYPCGWMFGDLNTNEIMLLELGKTKTASRRTHSGVFYGANFAHDPDLRNSETKNNAEIHDLKSGMGARNIRLEWLLTNEYWGKLNARIAKKIISDHYDVFHDKMQRGVRSICNHSEFKHDKPALRPFGAIDGKVLTGDMAKKLSFWGRWGSSCGRVFNLTRKYRQTHPFIPTFRNEPWTIIKPEK